MAAKTVLYKKTVKNTTNKTYESHLKTMEKILAQMRKKRTADVLTITKDDLLELLVNLEEQGCGAGPGFVSALRKHALCLGAKIDHLQDPAVDAAAKAVWRSAKAAKKSCGTLTAEQFEQLKAYLKDRGDDELFYACVIAFRARLRIGELYLVTRKDMVVEDGFVFIRLREWKQGKDGVAVNPDPKVVPSSLRAVIEACAARNFGSDGRLFGHDIDGRLRHALPEWAVALKWPDTLRWSGPHVFRHGGTQVLDQLAGKLGRVVLSIVAQQSLPTFSNYAKTAEQRRNPAS